MTQLKTVQEPLKLLRTSATPTSTDNINTVISFTNNIPQAALPTSTASAIIIPSTTLNYIKIVPVFKNNVASPNIKVTGWNKVTNDAGITTAYVPMCLFASNSMTIAAANNITVNGANDFRVVTNIVKAVGDAKIFTSTSVNDTAFLLVDTLGCELIEIEFTTTSAIPNGANVYYGAL
jgi:hypothetical protein